MATRMRFNPSMMRGLRRTPLIGRQQRRFNSTGAGLVNQSAFWTTNKVLLLSAFTGALAYTYGIYDAGSILKKEGANASQAPVYAKKVEWEKVSISVMCRNRSMLIQYRRLKKCKLNLVKIRLLQMMTNCIDMDSLSGRPLMLMCFPSLSYIPSPQRKCPRSLKCAISTRFLSVRTSLKCLFRSYSYLPQSPTLEVQV